MDRDIFPFIIAVNDKVTNLLPLTVKTRIEFFWQKHLQQ